MRFFHSSRDFHSFRMKWIDTGRLFQSLGPTVAKAQSPRCFNLDLRTESNPRLSDLSDLEGLSYCKMSERYVGARPCNALKTKTF